MRRRVTAPGARPNQLTDLMTQVYGPFLSLAQAREKGLREYFTGKPCKHGHISIRKVSGARCCACKAQASERDYEQRKNDPKKLDVYRTRARNRMRSQRVEKPELVAARKKASLLKRRNDADYVSWADRNPERKRELLRNWAQSKRDCQDLTYRLRRSLSERVRLEIKADGTRKGESTVSLLGCTIEEVRKHIESQFLPGMTWDNWSFTGWHLDHIRPCASFDLTDPEQQKQCFHYTNLQPLWAKDNLEKSAKWSPDPDLRAA